MKDRKRLEGKRKSVGCGADGEGVVGQVGVGVVFKYLSH